MRIVASSLGLVVLCLCPVARAEGSPNSFSSSGVRLQFDGWTQQPLDAAAPELLLKIEPNAVSAADYRTCQLERRHLPPVANMTQEVYNARVISSGGGQIGSSINARVVRRSIAVVDGVAVVDVDLDASQTGGPAIARYRIFARVNPDGSGDYFNLSCMAAHDLPPELTSELETIMHSLRIDPE